MSYWIKVKNGLKHLWPLTIHRFNQRMDEARQEQNAAAERRSKEFRKVADELALTVQAQAENMLSVCREEMDSIREACRTEADGIRTACEEQASRIGDMLKAEAASVHQDSSDLNERLVSVQEQVGRIEESVKKLSALNAVIHSRSDRLEKCLEHCIPRAELSFDVALAEHCDLNCAGCDHFSPLAKPEFPDIKEVSRDFARLSELFHGRAKVHLLGGEPLLNPDIIDYIKLAREYFPDGDIDITTNGVRLLQQPEEFWEACRDNRILIQLTKYPIALKFDEMEAMAKRYGVEYRYYGNTETVIKMTNLYRFDPEGQQNGNRNFLLCFRANTCPYLQHGRLYTCSIIPTAHHFNSYFNLNLKEQPEDSIDIFKANSAREIMDFLARPVPFCRYCMTEKTRWSQPWHQSERKIEEWT